MRPRDLAVGLLLAAFSTRVLIAGEAAPKPPAKPPAAAAETPEQRRARLAKLYADAERTFRDTRYRDAQRLYAQIALEQPNYRNVSGRLRTIRERLADADRKLRQRQVDEHIEAARVYSAAGRHQDAVKACEAALVIDPKNRGAQELLAKATGELELHRRVAALLADPEARAPRPEVLGRARTAVAEQAAAAPEEPGRPAGAAPAVRPAREVEARPPEGRRVVGPGKTIEKVAPPRPVARPGAPKADAEGRRLLAKAWDTYQAAMLERDPRPKLRQALDTLAPVTALSGHSRHTKDTAALLRASITRHLAATSGGRAVSPADARKARLYRRYTEAQELFRKKLFADVIRITDEIIAEDPRYTRARRLRQEARRSQLDEERATKVLDNEMRFEKEVTKVEEMGVPREDPPPVARPPFDPTRPTYEVTGPELEEKLNQRISVNLIEADLDYFLDLLFRSTGVNIIYNPEVVADKTITVHVANYPLRQLLDYIARNHDLMFTTTRDGVLITTPEEPQLETFILPLHHGLVDVLEAPPSAAISSGDGGAEEPLEPPTTSNVESLVEQFPQLIDWPQGSFTYLDRKMNILYARTTRNAYKEVVRLIESIDKQPVQVLIKTLFIEVDANEFETFGAEAKLSTPFDLGSLGSVKLNANAGDILKFPGEALPGESAPLSGGTVTLAGVLDEPQFEVTLDALQRVSKSRTLAAPNVICMNNCTARMSVTKDLVYVEDYEVDRSDISGTTYGNPYYQQQQQQQQQPYQPLSSEPIIIPVFAEGEDVGFTLDVTVSVGEDTRFITMTLNPRIREEVPPRLTFDLVFPVTQYQQQQTTTNGDTEPPEPVKATVERPIVAERSLSTKLVVADGSIVALGGLIQQSKIQIRSKIPILSDIPIIGQFIGRRTYRDRKTNLIVFVQAQIITPSGALYSDSGKTDTGAEPRPTRRVAVEEGRPPAVRAGP